MQKFRYSDGELEFMESSTIPFAVYQFINKRVYTIVLSDGFFELFGFKGHDKKEVYDLMDNNMYRDTHPDDLAQLGDAAYQFATQGGSYDVLYRSKKDGEYIIIHACGKHIYKDGVRLAFVWYTGHGPYIEDGRNNKNAMLSEIKNQLAERSINSREAHDFLTGLPSMTYFFELAEEGCRELRDEGTTPAIIFMDYVGMKGYNQKYGLSEGNIFLKAFSDVLVEHFSHENCSRFSADHFCIYTDYEKALEESARIIEQVGKPDGAHKLPLRVGIYKYDDEEISISGACDRAKLSCDSGRKNYESRIYIFEEEMLAKIEKNQYIVENLDRAISDGWIKVFYQPIIRAANGKVCSEEALARWQDPEKGILRPEEFIPALEEANIVYKLDLYVVEKILQKMKAQADSGLYVVPESVNLSRLDFYACDIVEEIRKRVDDAGIPRDRLVVELTESIIANDVNYMKKEILRFKDLGFTVWMDDYGSGYSSPSILQNLPFDIVKIDMQFVRQITESEKSKIILTEIVRMAMALGMDTIAEGVESKEQMDFLKEIGCTMLQGFYFCKAIPLEKIIERNRKEIQIGYENPFETGYYAQLGRVNLYDLSIPRAEDHALDNYFDTWPMIMLECSEDKLFVVRFNETFNDFVRQSFPGMYGKTEFNIRDYVNKPGAYSLNTMLQCARDGKSVILDDRSFNGKNIQLLVWRIAVNPVTGVAAVMAVILSAIKGTTENSVLTYNYIARALSEDYVYLYFVDLDTENYIEYMADGVNRDVSVERRGTNFFAESYKIARKMIYKDDQEGFFKVFTKENIEKSLRENGSFTYIYRNLIKGRTLYVSMKIIKIRDGGNRIVIGVNNIDAQMKEKEAIERYKEEKLFFSKMAALSGDFMSIYTIDPITDEYYQYSADGYQGVVGARAYGKDFYKKTWEDCEKVIFEEDKEYFYSRFKKEIILDEIRKKGRFIMDNYRLLVDGKPVYVQLKATMVHDKDEDKIIMGIINVDDEVRKLIEYNMALSAMEVEATTDELTGVKRKHAYLDMEKELDEQIKSGDKAEFAIAVFDINNLKIINDTFGHHAGDQYILDASRTICKIFQHSPVFRLGGDEFCIIAQGQDYKKIDTLMEKVAKQNEKNRLIGKVVLAAGMAKYKNEKSVSNVFGRADKEMDSNKKALKQ
ncbi:MAG: EAL domain-containing protein [Lachnospiraceae bacterium]|nr:EAL domain-containing protein [Lachnospiraceae bacterium]